MIKYFISILLYFNLLICAFNHKGQVWIDYNSSSSISSPILGYIPQFSIDYDNFDFTYSNKITFDSFNADYYKQDYRYWIRYNNKKIDLKAGLQKISFGSAFILRNLNWFDSIDFRNTTNQTIGQKALQIKYFSENNLIANLWIIADGNDDLSYGVRFESLNDYGSFGYVVFKDNNNSYHNVLNIPQIINNQNIIMQFMQIRENYRLGLDYRYDGIFGLWLESSFIKTLKNIDLLNSMKFSTVGIDYTINIWNGLYLMFESMSYQFTAIDNSKFNGSMSSLMIQYPIGILHDLSFIRLFDNKINDSYNLIRLVTTHDYYKVNYSYSINPEEYENNFEVMIIFNY